MKTKMKEKIKIGIIGVGNISEEHIQSYLRSPDAELYAFCDINSDRLTKMGEKYQITRLYHDYHEMLALPELDAVSVCTWNSEHAPAAIAALDAGKHVLCEKPMALSKAQAKEMREAALRNEKLLMIGFVRRFGNDCAILQDFINQDYFGELYFAKATYLRRKGNPGGWFGDKSRSGGGPLIDLGVHVIDLVRYLMGKPKAVSVYGATFRKLGDRSEIKGAAGYQSSGKTDHDICDVEDLATGMVRFENGAVLQIDASFSLNLKEDKGEIELFGTKAGAKLDPELEFFSEDCGYMTNVSLTVPTALSFDDLFYQEISHFLSCVKEGLPCLSPAEDGVEMMAILDALYKSAATGHEVILSLED